MSDRSNAEIQREQEGSGSERERLEPALTPNGGSASSRAENGAAESADTSPRVDGARNGPTSGSTDQHLLGRARSYWQFGEWEQLTALQIDTLENHPDRSELALLAAAGHQQRGNLEEVQQLARQALAWGCSKRRVSQVLIAGVYHSLGR